MIVEFLGAPGSGKSTLYEGIAGDFPGRVIAAGEVNGYRLKILGIRLKTRRRLINKNFERVLEISSLYRRTDAGTNLLVEKGIYGLLYTLFVRNKKLLTRLTFGKVARPTHLIALTRFGKKRDERDVADEARHGFDRKIAPFCEGYVNQCEREGVKVLILADYGSVEEDVDRVRKFLGMPCDGAR
jgi:hypothetical protein